jgi:hypothetical protein
MTSFKFWSIKAVIEVTLFKNLSTRCMCAFAHINSIGKASRQHKEIISTPCHVDGLGSFFPGWLPSYGNWSAIDIQFKHPGNHDHSLGATSVLQHREAERLCTVDEKSATKALIVLDDPISAAVSADLELQRPRAWHYRRVFIYFHDGLLEQRKALLPTWQEDSYPQCDEGSGNSRKNP